MRPYNKQPGRVQVFIEAYCRTLNATTAALEAGYTPRSAAVQGCKLLAKPDIAAAIKLRHGKRLAKAELSTDVVLEELRRIVTFDPGCLYDDAGQYIPIKQLPPEIRSVITQIDYGAEVVGAGEAARLVPFIKKIKFSPKLDALNLAMRHLGLLRDTLEVRTTVEHQIRNMSDDELQAEIRKTLNEMGVDGQIVLPPAKEKAA